jgi:hypothetical protein
MKQMKTGFIVVVRVSVLLLSALTLVGGGNVFAQIIYSNGFEGSVGSEWSSTTTSVTPIGARRFLGQFGGSSSVSLSLSSLPAHSQLTLSFDLFIIRSWDGSSASHADTFDVTVQGVTNLLHTTFGYSSVMTQAFPSAFPGGAFPGLTGASETNSLGYTFNDAGDSVYKLSFTLNHSASSITVGFTSGLDQALFDESWGLDNVVLAIVPEPSSFALCLLAGVSLLVGARSWRARF